MTKDEYLKAIRDIDMAFAGANKDNTTLPYAEMINTHLAAHGCGISDVLTMYPAAARVVIMEKLTGVILDQARKHGGALGIIERETDIKVRMVVDNDL